MGKIIMNEENLKPIIIKAPSRFACVLVFTIACVALILTSHPVWALAFFIMIVLMFGD